MSHNTTWLWYRIPGHALHEKGLQRQIGVVTLVSSQERRALAVPVINRLQTARQPRALFLQRFTYDFACSCFWGEVQAMCLRCLGGYEGRLSPGRTVLPDPAPPPRRAPRPDPPVVCPGFGFDSYIIPGYVWHDNSFQRNKKNQSTGQQPGMNSDIRSADKTLLARGSCFSIDLCEFRLSIPGHALHEKGLQR